MPCHTRMKLLLRGLFWLSIFEFGFMVTSLEPGFLDFDNLPDTNFSCVGKVIGGYYADLETSCQMFHVCTIGQLDEPMDIRFLCLNGTVFDQETRVCERIDEVDCSKSEQFYSLNLELYGNTQPPILEESPETEAPSEISKKSTTTTTSTTTRPTPSKTPRQSFIITTAKPPTTTPHQQPPPPHTTAQPSHQPPQQIPQPPKPPQPKPQIHFASNNQNSHQSPDIRFNPEEYKISLNPGAPPNIRNSANSGKPISFQTFSDNNKRVIVTTHTTVYKNELKQPLVIATATSSPHKEEEDDEKNQDYDTELSDSTEDSYSYGYHNNQPESLKTVPDYQTDAPKTYHFRPGFRPSLEDDYKPSTYRSVYHPATNNPLKLSYNHRGPTTYRNHYPPLKPSQQYYHRTDKPQRLQQLPLIPTLSPLTFSSPAPFSLNRHVETKRFIDHHQVPLQALRQQPQAQRFNVPHVPQQQAQQASHHQVHHQPPRIVISASASVSDASGRKFNYSLGTIGDTGLFGNAPHSYDDYKEDDVGSDPFYHDVPKLRRLKRQIAQVPQPHAQPQPRPQSAQGQAVDKGEEGEKEAIDVLKFLFNWYNNHEKTSSSTSSPPGVGIPIKAETITEINDEFMPQSNNQHIDYLYEDFDLNLNKKQVQDYVQTQTRRDYEKPYLSQQLLKPPEVLDDYYYHEDQRVTQPSIVPTITTSSTTPRTTTTSRTTTSTTSAPNFNYDYVDDNYEPLTYQHDIELEREQEKQRIEKLQEEKDKKDKEDALKVQLQNGARDQYQEKETYQISQNWREDALNEKINDQLTLYKEYKDYKDETEAQDERNYSLPEYVDDNYEPIVYNHKETVPTTLTTPTTLKVTANYQPGLEQKKDFQYSNQDQFDYKDISPIYTRPAQPVTTTELTTTVATESYQQVLGILGITTRKPFSEKARGKVNRGKARFSLSLPAEIAASVVPKYEKPLAPRSDFVSTTTTTTTTLSPVSYFGPSSITEEPLKENYPGLNHQYETRDQPKEQQKIEGTTEFQYTINVNRRTQDLETFTTELPSTEYVTEPWTTERKTTTEPVRTTTSKIETTDPYQRLGETTSLTSETMQTTLITPSPTEVPMQTPTETSTESSTEAYFNGYKLIEINQEDGVMSTNSKLATTTVPTTISQPIVENDTEVQTKDGNQTEFYTTTNALYTTIQLQNQNLLQDVEASTKSNFEIYETKQGTTGNTGYTSEGTTLMADIDILNVTQITSTISTPSFESTPSSIVSDTTLEAVVVTSFGSKIDIPREEVTTTIGTTLEFGTEIGKETTLPAPTSTSVPSTAAPPVVIPSTKPVPKYNFSGRNARRRSKSRFRSSSTTPAVSVTPSSTEPTLIVDFSTNPSTSTSTLPSTFTSTPSAVDHRFKSRRKPSINEEIVDVLKSKMEDTSNHDHPSKKIEFNINAYTANLAYRLKTTPLSMVNVPDGEDVIVATDPPISKSAKPTLSVSDKESKDYLPTTPISKSTAINVNSQTKNRKYTFNCIDKEINHFYSDPRDCRLFHYCTRGFTKTQYLDMKFVCDLGTFFDDEKLICTRVKPARCA